MKKLVLLLLACSVVMGAYIKPKTLKWTASTEADLAGYRVYLVPEAETMSYASPFVEIPKTETSYPLPGVFTITEGTYKLGVAAYDNNGNISDINEVSYFLDLFAPAPVQGVVVADL